jgi:prepilin-type N-terminal cleavage/methylation domain-containing protein
MIINKNNRKHGFTLIEMIVASVIFAIVITVYMGVYLATIRANSKMIAMQKTQNEIRYIIESLAREIRLGAINYDYYEAYFHGAIENPTQILALKDNLGNDLYFQVSDNTFQTSYDAITWANITTSNIQIDKMDFYIVPTLNPFTNELVPLRKQPGVIIYLDARYNEKGIMDGRIRLQTFITTRQYKQ